MSGDTYALEVLAEEAGWRVDKWLAVRLPQWSRMLLQGAIEAGGVRCRGVGVKKNHRVAWGEVYEVFLPRLAPAEVAAVPIPLSVLYEDEHVLAINKEAGMVVHPGAGTGEDTLVHAALHHTGGQLSARGGAVRPGVVHRLDKETSGVVLLAKSDEAHQVLTQKFAGRELEKRYWALVSGVPSLACGVVTLRVGRDPVHRTRMRAGVGREARTDWRCEVAYGRWAARLGCRIHTGRTHQIRVHLASLGHPVLADRTYGYRPGRLPEGVGEPARVMLHAWRLVLAHPVSGRPLELEAPVPQDFRELEAALAKGGV